jgi:hypothetical protein
VQELEVPEVVVEATLTASPAAVLASLTGRVAAHGWQLTGVGGYGSIVTWQAFDAQVELVTLRAEILPHPRLDGATCLRICRVDVALAAALDAALAAAPALGPPPVRRCAAG